MGTASDQETEDFLDQELINCGIIAGKRLALFEECIDPRIRINAQTKEVTLPNDFDYDSYQERQEAQPCIAEGTVKFNPVCGNFELVDDNGESIVIFKGDFYRQQNQYGEIELINGNFGNEWPTYRIRMIESEQDKKDSDSAVQYGPAAFDEYLGLDTSKPHIILFINDNTAKRFYMPEGGFANGTNLISSDGWAQDMPIELFVYNGIPKVKIGGILYEVVVGSSNDLEDFLTI